MSFDLAIVAAVLAAQGVFAAAELRRTALLGELGLDGRLRPVRGILPATLAAQQAGFTRVIVPLRQAGEAKLVEGIGVFGIASITHLVAFLQGVPMPLVEPIDVIGERAGKHANRRLDLADVVGQAKAKWACEVAATGRHHMLFHGPPGVGKTMLAERVPGLLPDLDVHDALEVSAVHSLAGFNLADELITRPPYSDPHHSASVASIVGGGQRVARPGAISRAHKGVLFLDESTEAKAIRLRGECIPARRQRATGVQPSTTAPSEDVGAGRPRPRTATAMEFACSAKPTATVMSASLASLRLPVTESTGIREVRGGTACRGPGAGTATGRIVIVEGSRELAPNHPHAALIEGRPANSEVGRAIIRTDLVRHSLRTRPHRLVG